MVAEAPQGQPGPLTETEGHSGPSPEIERRVHERVPLSLFGRVMFPNKLEVPCQTTFISAGGMDAIAVMTPEVGDNVIIYLDTIGRLNGPVVRVFEGGFAMTFDLSPRAQDKLVDKINWSREHAVFGTDDGRAHGREAPRQPISQMRLKDGRAYTIDIIDISLSGAAVRAPVRPALGTEVMLGGMRGKVVRHFDEGIAVEFLTVQDPDDIGNHFL